MKAIFYDRYCDLVRCQFAGMNEKGEPNWLVIEQGKPTKTLTDTEKEDHRDYRYRLLCVEGEEVNELTLLRILCSMIQGELEGWRKLSDDILRFMKDMTKHRVEWNRENICLRFRISQGFDEKGKYYVSVNNGANDQFLGAVGEVTDLDQLLEILDDFGGMLEDFVHIEKVNKIIDIRGLDEHLFSEFLLGRFDRVIKN